MKLEDLRYQVPSQPVDEIDFDIKRWRKENPMDYLKAFWLVNKSDPSCRDDVFQNIYRITRLYIPDVLYKFYSLTDDHALNDKKLDTLRQQKIFLADAKSLNDPFDGKAYYYNPSQLEKFERLSPHKGRLIDDFTALSKVTSLTENDINSMPMWAHYSNNHAGFCVSYDMKDNIALSSCTFPVQYCNERIDITSFMERQTAMIINEIETQSAKGYNQILLNDLSLVYLPSLLCNLKHSSWSYEKEFRCTTGATAEGMPYIEARPKEIFVGINCSPKHYEVLKEIANYLNLPIHKMSFDEYSSRFDLTFE